MSTGPIPAKDPVMDTWAVKRLDAALPADVSVATIKPSRLPNGQVDPRAVPPYRQVIVSETPMQKITEISRNFLITLEVWVVDANGVAQLGDAKVLAKDAAFIIESAPRDQNPIISAEVNSGPTELRDTDTTLQYVEVSVMATARRLP